MALREYRRKRNFQRTPEPPGKAAAKGGRSFVIQKHAARRLHYDFRLELDGVLKSWAVPKGPSLIPGAKSLAVHVEDHPLEYGGFEGVIPQGEYGGGTVMLWDRGEWEPLEDPHTGYRKGKLSFVLDGEKLHGRFSLVRMAGEAGEEGKNWLLIKGRDDQAGPSAQKALEAEDDRSVTTGRSMADIAAEADRVWSSESGDVQPSKRKADRSKPAKSSKPTRRRATAGKGSKPTNGAARRRRRPAVDLNPSALPGARKARLPGEIRPQLATLVKEAPRGDRWLHEMKFDGYRMLCRIDHGQVRLLTRHAQDWTDRFSTIAEAAERLPVDTAVLDGEIVVLADDGTTDFQALQNSLKTGRQTRFVYFLFDLIHLNGHDLMRTPLEDRKQQLQGVLQAAGADLDPRLQYSDHIRGQGETVIHHACRQAMEGIVSKRADSAYEPRRSQSWVKIKCLNRQEFVIGGYTDPSGARDHFGALLLGYYADAGRLVYCGKVGTGFTSASLQEVFAELKPRVTDKPPFDNPPRGREARAAHWVRPELVAEVEFTEWTSDGILRHPSFKGLREDKQARRVTREQPADAGDSKRGSNSKSRTTRTESPQAKPARRSGSRKASSRPSMPGAARRTQAANSDLGALAGVTLSNPDRVLYPEQDLTKLDLARYYAAIADWVLPEVTGRPLTLVRCPRGRAAKCFYQKHLNEGVPHTIRTVPIREKQVEADYLVIDDLAGLISLVQLGVLEIHLWGCRADQIERPDRLVFDLDPGEGVGWPHLIEAGHTLRDRLRDLGLESFPRTTGGKGLHLVVPITRRTNWDDAKQFTHDVADSLVRENPGKYIAMLSKAKRRGKIFVDYLRNGRGATAIASYSTRALPGATVAVPLAWDELTERTTPDQFTVKTFPIAFSR